MKLSQYNRLRKQLIKAYTRVHRLEVQYLRLMDKGEDYLEMRGRFDRAFGHLQSLEWRKQAFFPFISIWG